MKFLSFLLACILSMMISDFTYGVIGAIAFALGAKKFGHWMIGHLGGTFGLTQHWLYDNCPYSPDHKCGLWTCKGYTDKPDFPCKCQSKVR